MGAPGEGEEEQVLPGFLEPGSEGSKPRARGRTELLLLLPFVHFAISSACFLTVETQNFHKLWKLWQKEEHSGKVEVEGANQRNRVCRMVRGVGQGHRQRTDFAKPFFYPPALSCHTFHPPTLYLLKHRFWGSILSLFLTACD